MDGGNAKSLQSYEDLVFSPLALPEPPKVDVKRLIDWMTWGREEGIKRGFNVHEQGFEARKGRPYPWLLAMVYYGSRTHVEDSFDKEFPQLAQYARQFPVGELGGMTLMAQRPDALIRLHASNDGYWGLRFKLGSGGSEGLHFCTARQRVQSLPIAMDDWSPFLDLETKHFVRAPKGNRPYCINSIRAAHAVDRNCTELGERIDVMVFPRYGLDSPKLLSLLNESSTQFGEHQIWYTPRAS